MLPGGSGGVFQSALYWATVALVDSGWDVHVAHWSARPDEHEVRSAASAGLERLASRGDLLVLGKSLGSLAAPEVTLAGVRAIWLTPLMERGPVVEAIGSGDVGTLLVAGTDDPSWRRPPDRDGLHIREIVGANHGLLIPGDWRRSLAALGEVIESIVDFA